MNEEELFDKRIVARNIAKGRVSAKEYERYLASLEDMAKKAVPLLGDEELSGLSDRRGGGNSRRSQ